MLKVARLSKEPEESLILPSGKVNVDDSADKSPSRTSVQPVTQPKAPTDLKIKKKRIPPSSQTKSPYKVRVILPKKQVAETQHAEVTVATADATKSLVASELAEEQANQPSAIEAEKVLDQIDEEVVKESELTSMRDVTFEQLMDAYEKTQAAEEMTETPYDTEFEIKFIKKYQPSKPDYEAEITFVGVGSSEYDSGLRSMPDDDLASLTGFETSENDSQEGTDETLSASADIPALSDPLVAEDMQSYVPKIVSNTLKEQLSGLHSEALKANLPQLLQNSIKGSVSESIAEELP
ncbi:hypothetical protein Tco_1019625 [Tanacetum coccineum]|uniref:Uncharacterized protein n=1 Tax=Tanacetum coccineum TaxID=301880 RepID=A0ABQ5FZ50_9ASTR